MRGFDSQSCPISFGEGGNGRFVRAVLFADDVAQRGGAFPREALRLNGHETRTFDLDPSGVRPSTFYSRLSAWLQNLPKPCGVLAADDAYALHVHSAAQNLGLRIPADVAILGGDDESSSLATPGISSIRLDFQEAGRLAAELLLEKLAHPGSSPTSRHFGPVQVFRRGSTRKLRQARGDFTDILERIRKAASAGLSAAEVASWLPGSPPASFAHVLTDVSLPSTLWFLQTRPLETFTPAPYHFPRTKRRPGVPLRA